MKALIFVVASIVLVMIPSHAAAPHGGSGYENPNSISNPSNGNDLPTQHLGQVPSFGPNYYPNYYPNYAPNYNPNYGFYTPVYAPYPGRKESGVAVEAETDWMKRVGASFGGNVGTSSGYGLGFNTQGGVTSEGRVGAKLGFRKY